MSWEDQVELSPKFSNKTSCRSWKVDLTLAFQSHWARSTWHLKKSSFNAEIHKFIIWTFFLEESPPVAWNSTKYLVSSPIPVKHPHCVPWCKPLPHPRIQSEKNTLVQKICDRLRVSMDHANSPFYSSTLGFLNNNNIKLQVNINSQEK